MKNEEQQNNPSKRKEFLATLTGLSGVAIRRPVFTTMIMLGLVVLGAFSFRGLPIDQYPDVDLPIVTVQTVYPGASPESIEREVTRRLEEAFNPVQGVKTITSQTLEGVSLVIVEFELGVSVDQAAQDIRTKIDAIRRDLPADIDPPLVQKLDPGATPIVSISLSSERMSAVELTSYADRTLRRELESVSGVGEVRIAGGLSREIRILPDPERLRATGISVGQLMNALASQNIEVPAGRLERGNLEQLVRVTGRISEPRQFGEIIVATRNGVPIRLGDVAQVKDAAEDQRSIALLNSTPSIAMDILKVSGANTVDVADRVNEKLADLQKTLPEGTSIQVVRDNSVKIRHSVEDVIFELVLGAILTILIVMLFLNDPKATAITSLALPVSVISAFILMGALGFTLNLLTLMALSLSIGILIDDAIVVIENIVRRRELGEGYFEAAGHGTKEIILAVMATTLSIVAVFVPVAFMGGIIGRFFFQFGLTIAWAVLVSLFVSFTLTPMLAAWWGVDPHGAAEHKTRNPIKKGIVAFNRWFDRIAGKYSSVIAWALKHRKTTMALAVAAFVGSMMLFPLIGGGFMPVSDDGEFAVTFETPDGSTLDYTRNKAQEIIAGIKGLEAVDYTYTTIGAGQAGSVNRGEIYVKLVSLDNREMSQEEVMVAVRERLSTTFGAKISVLNAGGIGGAQAPLAVEVSGENMAELQALADTVLAAVSEIPGIVDVRLSTGDPRPEFRINVNRDVANRATLDVGQVASTVRPYFAGVEATRWEDPTGEEWDVVVQLPEENRLSIADLRSVPVPTVLHDQAGTPVTIPLDQVATVERGTAPARIDHKRLQRIITISASTTPEVSVSEASAAITERLATIDIPEGYSVGLGGETEQLAETGGYVLEAIMLAIILIFLILASQFESFTQPLAIMLSLPLSLIGVLLALLVTGDTLNMMSMIGVILLMGLVTKNAILLIDNANQRRDEGEDRFTALVQAGTVRLRPIMMTTLAMIAGMFPIALGMGEGGGFRAPMARAVIGGLITSTLLTLIVVPVAYTYFDGLGTWFRTRFGGKKRREEKAKRKEAKAVHGPAPGTDPALFEGDR